eukprot:2413341-Pyramimonas_sp.AAC.1
MGKATGKLLSSKQTGHLHGLEYLPKLSYAIACTQCKQEERLPIPIPSRQTLNVYRRRCYRDRYQVDKL